MLRVSYATATQEAVAAFGPMPGLARFLELMGPPGPVHRSSSWLCRVSRSERAEMAPMAPQLLTGYSNRYTILCVRC